MQSVGLSSAEAAARLAADGPNQLVEQRRWQRMRRVAALLVDPMAIMLVLAGVVDWVLGQRVDATILFAALAPVLGVDVVLEARSERALARLRDAVAPTARVVRDGREQRVATSELVRGDVVVVGEGDVLFADARVLEGSITVDESHLTGESEPQYRERGAPIRAGSYVLGGRAPAEVTATGKATSYGKLATLVAEAKSGTTPLQGRIARMVRRLYTAAVIVALVELGVNLATGVAPSAAVIAAVTLAMAAAPEEFPLVFTIFLSLGAARLARTGVLVRRLVSVEALGSTTVICIDKTGTLTHGRFELDDRCVLDGDDRGLLEAAALACEPAPDDAMELAIARRCTEHGVGVGDAQLVGDLPFEVSGRHMTHVWQRGARWTVAMKGALEGVLEHCAIAPSQRERAHATMSELAARGMRVLAVARRDGDGIAPRDRVEAEHGVTLVGLLGFRDPVRAEARDAVAACRRAGIAIKIVTGDHPLTARAIADAVGLAPGADQLVTGPQLEQLAPADRSARIRAATVLARIKPEQKYEIVDCLVTAGEVVAMAGDGINDAPALRRASIGISMGARATEVAREAAGLVLLRDDLLTIVASVREGRHIFANLQRAFLFLVAFHVPVIGLALTAPLVGVPILLPIHLVWLELVIHPIAALVFEAEPAPANVMSVPPRSPAAPMLPRGLLVRSIGTGLILTAGAFAIFIARRHTGDDAARTAAFAAVLAGGLAVAWIERGLDVAWWRTGVPRTKRFWVVAVAIALSLPIVLAIPALSDVMHVARIGLVDVALALSAAFAAIAWRTGTRRVE